MGKKLKFKLVYQRFKSSELNSFICNLKSYLLKKYEKTKTEL